MKGRNQTPNVQAPWHPFLPPFPCNTLQTGAAQSLLLIFQTLHLLNFVYYWGSLLKMSWSKSLLFLEFTWRKIQDSRKWYKWDRNMSIIPPCSLTSNTGQIIALRNCVLEQDSLKFPRHFHPWKNSIIWIGTSRGRPRAGRSSWNQNVLRRRSSHRSGRTRLPYSASAWWEPWGPTGWPTPCSRGQGAGDGRHGQSQHGQSHYGQTSRDEHKSQVFLVMGAFVPTSKIPWGLYLPCVFLICGWTVWKEVLISISTEKDAGHMECGRRWWDPEHRWKSHP